MNNLDICKRIAEIEGIQHQLEQEDTDHCYVYSEELSKEYNPLTDDALCFQFCYEEGIVIKKCSIVVDNKMEWDGKYYARHPKNQSFGTVNKNPNKAVCLEYIEAHKELLS